MDISSITDEHFNRTSHGSHPLQQIKQGYNSAMHFFFNHKGLESEIQESLEKQQLSDLPGTSPPTKV